MGWSQGRLAGPRGNEAVLIKQRGNIRAVGNPLFPTWRNILNIIWGRVGILTVNPSQRFVHRAFFPYPNQRDRWRWISERLFRKKESYQWTYLLKNRDENTAFPFLSPKKKNRIQLTCTPVLPSLRWWLSVKAGVGAYRHERSLSECQAGLPLCNSLPNPWEITAEYKLQWNTP